MPMLVVIATAGVMTLDRLLVDVKVIGVVSRTAFTTGSLFTEQEGLKRWLRRFVIE
jgi:hypothetical protein